MIARKTQQQNGGSKHRGSPKTTLGMRHPRQIPQPIKSWTNKPVRVNGKLKENGIITSPRMLSGKGTAVPVKQTVGGEWVLKECEEHTAWVNGLLKKGRQRPIGDLRKSVSDGLMLVTLLEILFHAKIPGIQTRPIIRAQRLENIHLCLRFLEGKGVDTQHLSPDDITDGNLQATLGVIGAIRRRFETNYTSSSLNNGSSMNSVDKSDIMTREGSINSSQMSGISMMTPRSLQNGDAQGNHSGQVNGDILPGTMADSPPEESPRIALDRDTISTTEINTHGISQQHGVELRRLKFRDQPAAGKSTIRPQPVRPPAMAWNSAGASLTNGKSPAVRESLSMTVEERLKSLLDTPNPGGMSSGSQYLYDEGELLELPPPKLRSYLNEDDDDDDEDDADENAQLHAMLEDPDRFDNYPKDWDRYVSGYVPSTKAEKKKGPRAQALLDRPADTPSTSQERMLPFFHAPPSQHMGPMQSTPNVNAYHNGPQPMHMPGTSPETSGIHFRQTPNGRLQNSTYQSPSSPSQRRLPTYQDHIQRHPIKQNQYSHTSRGHEPEGSGGTTTPSAFRIPQNYEQPVENEKHQQMQEHLNPMYSRTPANAQHIPMENVRPNRSYSNPSHPSNHEHKPTNAKSSESQIHNGPIRDSKGLQSFVPSPSSSSSRSNTPELPPLTPASTPPETPPDSPLLMKRKSRSISASAFPYHFRTSQSGGKEVVPATQVGMGVAMGVKKKIPGQGTTVATKSPNVRGSAGKGKRKITRQRASTLQPSNGESLQKKKSSKALPNTHRHNVHLALPISDSSSDEDIKSPPPKPERKHRKKVTTSVPQPPVIEEDDMDGSSADSIRQQLLALESMYKEILQVISSNKSDTEVKKPARRQVSTTVASPRAVTTTKPKASAKAQKQREKDIKTVNKRFARVEAHVVTLARSVASLSSELRSQNAILREIDCLRHDVDRLRDTQLFDCNHGSMYSNGNRFRPMLPPHTSPQRIRKLTKFFGEEPPLLRMFLQELGYEKYAAAFEKEGIGMIELPYLSEERLELIGIPIGPRLRILQEAQLMV